MSAVNSPTITITVTGSVSPSPPPSPISTGVGIIIALYSTPSTSPTSTWGKVAAAQTANPNCPIGVIFNPGSGPVSLQGQTAADPAFLAGAQMLKSSGCQLFAYDHTCYADSPNNTCQRPYSGGVIGGTDSNGNASVESDLLTYQAWYGNQSPYAAQNLLSGVFFDEMANVSGYESYYDTASAFARSVGLAYSFGNPGTSSIPSYVGTVNSLTIFEQGNAPTIAQIQANTFYPSYPKADFSMIAYSTAYPGTAYVQQAAQYVQWMYLSDAGPAYTGIPSYLDQMASDLATYNG